MNKTVKLVELFIYSQQRESKDGKKKWIRYSTKCGFRIKDEDGKLSKDFVPCFIDVKFTDEAFNDSPVQLKDIKRGILKVDATKIGCPDIYEVKENEDGTKEYPVCFIRGGIASFTPVTKEHEFHFITEEDTNEVDTDTDNE